MANTTFTQDMLELKEAFVKTEAAWRAKFGNTDGHGDWFTIQVFQGKSIEDIRKEKWNIDLRAKLGGTTA